MNTLFQLIQQAIDLYANPGELCTTCGEFADEYGRCGCHYK
jgi:hypothetical protein